MNHLTAILHDSSQVLDILMVQMQYLTMNKALGPRRAAILSLVALYDPVEPFIIKYAPAVATATYYSLDCFGLTIPVSLSRSNAAAPGKLRVNSMQATEKAFMLTCGWLCAAA